MKAGSDKVTRIAFGYLVLSLAPKFRFLFSCTSQKIEKNSQKGSQEYRAKKKQKKEKKKEVKGAGECGGTAPAKILIFEHFYDALSPFDPRNRILSARTLRSSIFRAIRALHPDFQIQEKQEYFEILYPRRCKGKYKT